MDWFFIPTVLKVKMSTRAKTCADVLYVPFAPDPHTGFLTSSSCRFANSARSNSVGMADHDGAVGLSIEGV